ncbi:MAG: DUF418 domain-containing protein [Fimbriimonadaceae bacterium]|nr:DUF418 domain-containing protein [Fimbriimonadaceae bacterium]
MASPDAFPEPAPNGVPPNGVPMNGAPANGAAAPSDSPEPVAAPSRIVVLDVARGIAILGILIANIEAFAHPTLSFKFSGGQRQLKGTEMWANAFVDAFASGKFRNALAILFGIGLYMQYQRAAAKAAANPQLDFKRFWPAGYRRRTGLLMLLGAIHGIFIWYGDILFTYSVVSFVMMALVSRLGGQQWRNLLIGLGVFHLICCGGLAGGMMWTNAISGADSTSGAPIEFWPFRLQDEVFAYRDGTYLDQLKYRAVFWPVLAILIAISMLPSLIAMFSIGVIFQAKRFLEAPSQHPKMTRWLLITCLGGGILLNWPMIFLAGTPALKSISVLIEVLLGPILAVGWLTLIAVIVEKSLLRPITTAISKVGQMALSNYLLQSVICSTIFYSWGFGQFGRWHGFALLAFVPAVWVVNLIFSHLWLSRYTMGPVEWAWRSAVARQRLPIRRANASAAA